ncbi:PAS domain-containing protein [Noviherbaspirillum sedimenti]|uniref:Uncharacterized protein n=1 Tax=Noviherbaspirillum sedimenti TaxID=2320865 RepID=A0A3A3FVN4_9BURK|nr:hypothetical protein D3878_00290 [Noviherbaspirillum sedimenti]
MVTHDGRCFKVRTIPYCSHDNLINGVVITFSGITVAKMLEEPLRQEIETSTMRKMPLIG